MTTIKSFTSLEQSRKLAEILPLESADMYWMNGKLDKVKQHPTPNIIGNDHDEPLWDGFDVPCWSLAALLGVLPNNKHITTTLSRGGWKIEPIEYIDKWFCEYEDEVDEDSPSKNFSMSADNPVDACVAMVKKLHKLKML